LDCGGGHGHDGNVARRYVVRGVVADEVGGAVAVYDGHLDVHEDDVWLRMWWVGRVGCGEVVEGFFAVPDCRDFEAEFADRFDGYLLVDGTMFLLARFSGQ